MTAYYSFSNALTLNGVIKYGSSKGYKASVYAQKLSEIVTYGVAQALLAELTAGFTMSVYKKFGYRIPRTSREQSTYGKKVVSGHPETLSSTHTVQVV